MLWPTVRPTQKSLALLGDDRLKCSEEQLVEALTGRSHPMHRQMLVLQLERLRLLDEQIAKLNILIAQAMKPHQDTVIRLAEVLPVWASIQRNRSSPK